MQYIGLGQNVYMHARIRSMLYNEEFPICREVYDWNNDICKQASNPSNVLYRSKTILHSNGKINVYWTFILSNFNSYSNVWPFIFPCCPHLNIYDCYWFYILLERAVPRWFICKSTSSYVSHRAISCPYCLAFITFMM